MPITKLTPENNYPYLQERLQQLEQAVPEAFADGKINWDTLREILIADLEDEGRDEYFGLNWPGKREARKRAATPSHGTLVPAPGEGVNEDTTENLFIEGDNLEVLKLLQKSYAGKIKMIYIDPPYNTGNDFIYNDDFTDPLEAYLQYTGAKGESGELLTTNTRADGRFHSRWLNMMYPRLILARQLLRDDGVIFVSIDDNEVYNLYQILIEIFGNENFIAQMIHKNNSMKNQSKYMGVSTEYVLIFSKNMDVLKTKQQQWRSTKKGASDIHAKFLKLKEQGLNNEEIRGEIIDMYSRPKYSHLSRWNKVDDYGVFKDQDLSREGGPKDYTIINPETDKPCVIPSRGWGKSLDELLRLQKENLIWYGDETTPPGMKTYLTNDSESVPDNFFFADTAADKKLIDEMFGPGVFEYPKSLELMNFIIQLCSEKDSLIMDFFAGSCTTAHAILQLNQEDKFNRKFILIQLPEQTEEKSKAHENGFLNVSDIGKERIRRVIRYLEAENSEETRQIPLLQHDHLESDLGFKVIKYFRSNFKNWKPQKEENVKAVTQLFDNVNDPLVQGWKKEDLLSEILLLEGYPLTSKIAYLEDHLQNQVYRVTAPNFCDHDLFVCLDEAIQPATVNLLKMEKEDVFICLDSALSDELKARVQDKFNVHVI